MSRGVIFLLSFLGVEVSDELQDHSSFPMMFFVNILGLSLCDLKWNDLFLVHLEIFKTAFQQLKYSNAILEAYMFLFFFLWNH